MINSLEFITSQKVPKVYSNFGWKSIVLPLGSRPLLQFSTKKMSISFPTDARITTSKTISNSSLISLTKNKELEIHLNSLKYYKTSVSNANSKSPKEITLTSVSTSLLTKMFCFSMRRRRK